MQTPYEGPQGLHGLASGIRLTPPHLWPVFLLLPKLQPHWPCCCEYTKVIPALGPFIVSHTWNIHSSLVGSSFVSQGPAQVLPPHRGIYSTAVQCLQRSKLYFPCPLLLGFQVVIQVRPSDAPHEVCEMSVGPQEAEPACGNAAVSAGLACSDGFRGRCSIVCSLCAYPAVGCGVPIVLEARWVVARAVAVAVQFCSTAWEDFPDAQSGLCLQPFQQSENLYLINHSLKLAQ